MKISASINLTNEEVKICQYIAKRRQATAREHGVTDRKIGNQSNNFTDENGFGGEFAFCKLFNVMPDFWVKNPNTDLPKYDVKLPCGLKIDVKTTKYETGRLVVAKWKAGDVDCYALMTGTMPTYTLRGFFTKEATMKDCNLQNLGHGEGYVVPQALLLELDDIYKLTPASYCV